MPSQTTSREFRVCCSVNMSGGEWEGDWQPWEGDQALTNDEIKHQIGNTTYKGNNAGQVSRGCDEALELAGFDYWVEVRDAA